MRFLLCVFLFLGAFVVVIVPSPVSGQAPAGGIQFRDKQGNPIPSDPANQAFKLINGFPEYLVGRGDILEIITFQAGTRSTESVRVFPDGTISFSVLYDILAAERTPSELSRYLTEALSQYVRNARVQVFVKEYLSKQVYVFGALNRVGSLTGKPTGPGVYPLRGRITALEQILQAGGPSPDARLSQVRLVRGNKTYVLDLTKGR